MQSVRLQLIGGFLGSGKTTTIRRLAWAFQSSGLKVAIVTNDQADDLVDTHWIRLTGFPVGQVVGSCFCCNFQGLVETVGRIREVHQPDLILAEPVGSCTDIVATVVRPFRRFHSDHVQLASFAVLLTVQHCRLLLDGRLAEHLPPNTAYILEKQLEEADYILLNRIDESNDAAVEEMKSGLQSCYAAAPCFGISAKTGAGFENLVQALGHPAPPREQMLQVDYQRYADGEADLGWLNATACVSSPQHFELDCFCHGFIKQLHRLISATRAFPAHVKCIAQADGRFAVANLVASEHEPTLAIESSWRACRVDVIVNARVATDPELLSHQVSDALESACISVGARFSIGRMNCFRPAPPCPTYRLG